MKKLSIFFIFLLKSAFIVSQTNPYLKTKSLSKTDNGKCIVSTSDDNFIIGGSVDADGFGVDDNFISKINSNGDTIWFNIYSTGGYAKTNAIKETFDKGFVAISDSWSGNSNIFLYKTDSLGQKLWQKNIGNTGTETSLDVIQTKDSGFVILGTTDNYNIGNNDILIIKTNLLGDTLWTKIIGTDSIDIAASVVEVENKNLLFAGQTWAAGKGEGDGFLMKTDSAANIIWTKLYGGKWDEYFAKIIKTSDNNFILAGNTESWLGGTLTDTLSHPGFNQQDSYVVKVTSDGDTLWTKTIGAMQLGFEEILDVTEIDDSLLLCVGRASGFSATTAGYYFLLNKNGDTLWTKIIDEDYTDILNGVAYNKNNSIIIGSTRLSSSSSREDILVLKPDLKGNIISCYSSNVNSKVGGTNSSIQNFSGFQIKSGIKVTSTPNLISKSINPSENILCYCNIESTIIGDDSICSGQYDSLYLSTNGTSYLWNNGSNQPYIIVNPNTTSTYWVISSNDTCSIKSTFQVNVVCTGVEDEKNTLFFNLYPNPSDDKIYLNSNNNFSNFYFEIYNNIGQLITNGENNGAEKYINIQSLNEGIYFLKVVEKKSNKIYSSLFTKVK